MKWEPTVGSMYGYTCTDEISSKAVCCKTRSAFAVGYNLANLSPSAFGTDRIAGSTCTSNGVQYKPRQFHIKLTDSSCGDGDGSTTAWLREARRYQYQEPAVLRNKMNNSINDDNYGTFIFA